MIKIIENNMKEPISITCGECKSTFSFEYTDIQRMEESNLLFPMGITNIRRFIVCPVCKATLNFKVPQHLDGTDCGQMIIDDKLPGSEVQDVSSQS